MLPFAFLRRRDEAKESMLDFLFLGSLAALALIALAASS